MNKMAFLDELLEHCSLASVVKRAYAEGSGNTIDVPAGMMDGDPTPPQLSVIPDEASSRLPATAGINPIVKPGLLGAITDATSPIDREKFNRCYDGSGSS